MDNVCQGDGCPRRWVCKKADVVMAPAFILDYRRLGDCRENNGFALYERGKRSEDDLLQLEKSILRDAGEKVRSIERSREFLVLEEGE